jgi:copper chaperone CopZ
MSETLVVNLPGMYADHHVVKVRQIVAALPGVGQVRASAARQQVSLDYDPAQQSAETIRAALAANGYVPDESLATPVEPPGPDDLRHVLASDQAELIPEAKYTPPPQFGACPGLEPRVIAGEHPADRT